MVRTSVDATPDRQLDRLLRRLILLGAVLVLCVPAARGSSTWLGAGPLWLLAMPLASWCALHRFRLPRSASPMRVHAPRRRRGAQARRRPVARPALARAA